MSTSWLPPDIATICSERHSNLTQCSSTGFMFLALVTRLFGGVSYSINYPKNNTYPTPLNFTHASDENKENTLSENFKLYSSNKDLRQYQNEPLESPEHQNPSQYDLYADFQVPNSDNPDFLRYRKTKTKKSQKYDFIIIGAGSAGCVLANRLSEVKKWRILLIEAGDEEPDVTMIPSIIRSLKSSSIDWDYKTQPENYCCRSMSGQICKWTRGKTLGGSSAVNYLVYMRGNRRDYDHWAELGNHGWSYNELLPYFKKSEDNRDIEAYNTRYHGVGGPINVERFPYLDATTVMLVEALKETGLPLSDLSSENNFGTNIALSTSKDGRRVSINQAYIKPIRDERSNLDIVLNAFATKLIIDPKTKTAVGVNYIKNGTTYNVFARKEVIVSSGAVNSPKLLMLSGIGPKDHLESLHIPVIVDLQVGRNLQDHVTTHAVTIALSNKTSTMVTASELFEEVKKYYKQSSKKSGPLSTSSTVNSIAFIKTKYAFDDAPDIQFHFDGINIEEFYSDPQTYIETGIFPVSFYNGLSVKAILLTPKSRGTILLNKTDPVYGPPLIYPGFFTHKEDMDTLVEAYRYALHLEDTIIFKRNGARFSRTPVKNCESHIWGSYDYFSCLLIEYTTTIFHPSGTCKMGPPSDKEAVVDQRLRVYGVKNLRVVDGSIMPFIVRGNTNIPIVTIAERASDFIKDEYIQKPCRH